jgi:coenzyme PQQ precursor peptide PqqA
VLARRLAPLYLVSVQKLQGRPSMAWTTPTLVEICIGLEINGYLPAEF